MKFKVGREKKVIDTNPDACLWHASFHYVVGIKTFQTSPWKMMFGGWTALHALLGQCGGRP
jgi:hypothetical protein